MQTGHRLSAWLKRIYSRLKLFELYLFTYLLLLAAVLLCIMPITRRAEKNMRDTCLQQQQYALNRSANLLERQLRTLSLLSVTFGEWQDYMEMRLMTPESFSLSNYYDLSKLQRVLQKQFALLEINSYGFILFTRSGAALSTLHFSEQAESLFAMDLCCEYEAAQLKELCLDAPDGFTLIPLSICQVGPQAAQDGVLAIYRPSGESAVFGMLMQEQALKKALLSASMPQEGTLFLRENAGDELFALGANNAPSTLLVAPLDLTIRLELAFELPDHCIQALIRPFSRLNIAYLAAAVCLGVLMSVLFSLANTLPIRKLLRKVRAHTPGAHNEYRVISQAIDRSAQENRTLREQRNRADRLLSRSLFMRLLYQEYCPADDLALVQRYLPQLSAPHRLVFLRLMSCESAAPGDGSVDYLAMEQLSRLLAPLGLYTQTGSCDFALLIQEDGQSLSRISQAVLQASQTDCLAGLTIWAGASDVFSGAGALHTAFRRARFALCPTRGDLLSVYAGLPREEPLPRMNMADLGGLQHLLIACESDKAAALFQRLLRSAQGMPDGGREAERVCMVTAFLLRSVCSEMNLKTETDQMLAVDCSEERLVACIRAVTNELRQRSATPETRLVEQLHAYIEENYMNPSLSMDSMAEHFGVSKSYLYRIAKEGLHETAAEHIERVRMQHAESLLNESALNVKEIAAACGYNSSNTFYKAYRKRFQTSPKAARSPAGPQ